MKIQWPSSFFLQRTDFHKPKKNIMKDYTKESPWTRWKTLMEIKEETALRPTMETEDAPHIYLSYVHICMKICRRIYVYLGKGVLKKGSRKKVLIVRKKVVAKGRQTSLGHQPKKRPLLFHFKVFDILLSKEKTVSAFISGNEKVFPSFLSLFLLLFFPLLPLCLPLFL